jgi:hypothetical protein
MSGSGFLIDGGYIVTCAHVTWPFENVTATFPNGSEFQVQVLNYDLMADIAVFKPVSVNISPLSLASQANISIGDPVFAIGYPGDNKEHTQPTLSQGITSTFRNSTFPELTYIQTDAATGFGQSGGGLFSNKGEFLGMFLYTYGSNFALAMYYTDLSDRVSRLINGEDVAGLGPRLLPTKGGQKEFHFTLEDWVDNSRVFVIRQPEGTTIDIEATCTKDISLLLFKADGYWIDEADDHTRGTESISTNIDDEGPCFLAVISDATSKADIELSSSCNLIPLDDVDDFNEIEVGDTISASLDYVADVDFYFIDLSKNEKIDINLYSLMIDSALMVFPQDLDLLTEEDLEESSVDDWLDDDSGGGLLSTNAQLEFTAPKAGTYVIMIGDSSDESIGGYTLTIE